MKGRFQKAMNCVKGFRIIDRSTEPRKLTDDSLPSSDVSDVAVWEGWTVNTRHVKLSIRQTDLGQVTDSPVSEAETCKRLIQWQ